MPSPSLMTNLSTNTLAQLGQTPTPIQQPATVSNHNQQAEMSSPLAPISFVQPAASSNIANPFISTSATNSAYLVQRSCLDDVILKEDNFLELRNGELIIAAIKRILVNAGSYNIIVEPGTIAMLAKHGQIIAIRNLYDIKFKGLHFESSGQSISVYVGQEAILGPDSSSIDTAIQTELIARRLIHGCELSTAETMVTSEFSILSLMQNSDIFSHIAHSSSGNDKALKSKLLKMAAIIQQLQTGHGAYSIGKL